MVTREQVETLYRLILQRPPESIEAVDRWLGASSFSELLEAFVKSEEYKQILGKAASHARSNQDLALMWPRSQIETIADSITMDQIFAHIKEDWTALGEQEPYYSVLSTPEYLSDSFSNNTTTFFESGQIDVERLLAFSRRAGVELPYNGSCLELGCGVGRLTRWLSNIFRKVIAVDISLSHLNLAKSNLSNTLYTKEIDFVQLQSPMDIDKISGYDMFFSVIVMQHNPPPIIAYTLHRILSGLNHGGFAYFQIPTYKLGYSFNSKDYIDGVTQKGEMEMHVLPQSDIFRIGEQTGCRFIEVREDAYTGHADGISNTFFLFKP